MKNSLSLFLKSILIFTLVLVFSLPVYSEESEITTGETSEYIFMEDSEAIDIFGSAFEDFTIEEKILILREIFPAGTYWNGYNYNGEGERYLNVSNIGCAHKSGIENCNAYVGKTKNYFPYSTNIQCLGFASLISDFLFDKECELEVFYDFDELKLGDHIRLVEHTHSMIVIEKGDDYVKVVESNRDYNSCIIVWDREFSKNKLLYSLGSYEFYRRIP